MRKALKYVLSTRPLGKEWTERAAREGLQIEEKTFIRTEPVINSSLQADVLQLAGTSMVAIFTSMNAVEAVAGLLGQHQPQWRVGCLGHTTRQLVGELLPHCRVVATGNSAEELGHNLLPLVAGEKVVFFCSSIRRDALPQVMAAHGIPLQEMVVYKTEETPLEVDRQYDAMLFFSPSAVRSFFRVNTVPAHTVLFATGETTAAELRTCSNNPVVVADAPGKVALMEKLWSWYSNEVS